MFVRVPATVANLGSGFDALGVALRLYLEVEAELSPAPRVSLEGEGETDLPTDETNLVLQSMARYNDAVGLPVRPSSIRVKNRIPLASGLGSSAAAVVAGLLAAQALSGRQLPPAELLRLAAEIDGHADNVAPALLGGFVICYRRGSDLRWLRLLPCNRLVPILAVPRVRFFTAEARDVLPPEVSFADAQFSASRAALVTAVLLLGETGPALCDAWDDRLHEPHRLRLLPDTATVRSEFKAAGLPTFLAGSGPSLVVVVPTSHVKELAKQASEICQGRQTGWRVLPTEWEPVGATTSAR